VKALAEFGEGFCFVVVDGLPFLLAVKEGGKLLA
jgi:hypothetical protein